MQKNTTPQSPEAVAVAAYYDWLNAGMPTGKDMDFWLQAESKQQAGSQKPPIDEQKNTTTRKMGNGTKHSTPTHFNKR